MTGKWELVNMTGKWELGTKCLQQKCKGLCLWIFRYLMLLTIIYLNIVFHMTLKNLFIYIKNPATLLKDLKYI